MATFLEQLNSVVPTALTGRVVRTVGTTIAVSGFPAPLGAMVEVQRHSGGSIWGEVVGFRDHDTLIFPLGNMLGVRRGDPVVLRRTSQVVHVGPELMGRVVDGLGNFIDSKPKPALNERVPLHSNPPRPLDRPPIDVPLSTGIRAIDGLLTCGCGQRMGIFAGSGVGKSVMLGMMSRATSADVNVIALIGERGREVNEFLQRDLGEEGLSRSVVVVATSDQPAAVRVRAAFTATAIAEYFRDQGNDVLLLMDSVTRFALAQREIGLAAGEPPTTRGFPPSVFALLPRLVERAGRAAVGSITAFYSVLIESDDPQEPIGDCVRGLLDGHTWLSRRLAGRGQWPAIDILQSISRVMSAIVPQPHADAAQAIRELMGTYEEHEDVISVGAYPRGSNPLVDAAIAAREPIRQFLKQGIHDLSSVDAAREALLTLAAQNVPTKTAPAKGVAARNLPGRQVPNQQQRPQQAAPTNVGG